MTHRKTLFTKASILAIAATIALPSITITLPACSQTFPRERNRERIDSQPATEQSVPFAANRNLYKPNPGSYQVSTVNDLTLFDSRRGRELPLKVYYPQGLRGPAPVIIFSHGGGGSKEGFTYISEFWASQGYICIHPTHDDPVRLRETEEDAAPAAYRPQDISFVIDSFSTIENRVPELRGKLDRNRIGVAGHSYGAYTTMLLAGSLVDTGTQRDVSFRDNRIRAFLAISPAGVGRGGLDNNSWSRITSPVMTVAGTNESGDTWRIQPFSNMPAGDKYYALFEGAYHSSFNDFKPEGRRGRQQDQEVIETIHLYLQSLSIAFWDTYLRQDNTARQFLQSEAIASNGVNNFTPRSEIGTAPRNSRRVAVNTGSGDFTLLRK